MSNKNLRIDLEPREDSKGNIYYIGRLQVPLTIDFTQGLAILVFLSESGDEELQLAMNDKNNFSSGKVRKRRNRLDIPLDVRTDRHKKQFYIAKVQIDATVSCNNEVVFLVFTSRAGKEEVQIVGEVDLFHEDPPGKAKQIEVIYK
jgi:hypothetical protein